MSILTVSSTSILYIKSPAELPAILTDVWVDFDNGIYADNITGDPEHPFQTVDYSQSRILATEENPIVIHIIGNSTNGNIELISEFVTIDGGNSTTAGSAI